MATTPFSTASSTASPLKTAAAKPDTSLTGAIASQLLGIANDTGTHTTGHAASFTSHAADRAAASSRFSGYQADAKTAAKRAAKTILGRNKGITKSYSNAGKSMTNRADSLQRTAEAAVKQRGLDAASAANDLGLTTAPPTQSRADTISDMLTGQSQSVANAWKGFDQVAGRHAVERNTGAANSAIATGDAQSVTLNGLLENVLAGLKDVSTSSTLKSVGNTSTSQKLQALTGLRYLNSDEDSNTLAQQKLLASLNPKTSTSSTVQYGSNGQKLGSSTTTRK